jgi:hypothetical protein
MMIRLIMVLGLSSLCLAAANAQTESQRAEDSDWIALPQVASIVGVPVMPGLHEAEDETIVFDKPGGRIMEARLEGTVSVDEVLAWYKVALNANGWQQWPPAGEDGAGLDATSAHGLHYRREGENLQLSIMVHDQGVDVHLSLAPLEPK